MQFVPDTFNELTQVVVENDEAFFLDYSIYLMDELLKTVDQNACLKVDGQGDMQLPPFSIDTCIDLPNDILVTRDKMFKCNEAARDGKISQLDQACQAARTHLEGLIATTTALPPEGQGNDPANDPGNRTAEVRIRVLVAHQMFTTMTIPSFQDRALNPDL